MPGVFRLYSKDMLPLYLFVCVLFLMGVVFGALLVNSLTLQQKQEVGQYLDSFLQVYAVPETAAAASEPKPVLEVFGSHARWALFIWILGLSVVGVPIILLLDFLKGVLVGFTVGYLAGQWSWRGIMFAFVSVAPQNIFIVPSILICSVAAISFSILLVRNRLFQRAGTVGPPLMTFTFVTFALTGLLFGVAAFEAYISPELLKWAVPTLLEAGV